MKLLLMRHGEASFSAGRSDKDRPLTMHGKDQAIRAGKWLKSRGLCPDVILCSSAIRTRQTWEMLFKPAHIKAEAHIMDDLYLANPNDLLEAMQRFAKQTQCLLMIAHNPGVSTLASALSGQRMGMGTGHIVVVDQKDTQARLIDHFTA